MDNKTTINKAGMLLQNLSNRSGLGALSQLENDLRDIAQLAITAERRAQIAEEALELFPQYMTDVVDVKSLICHIPDYYDKHCLGRGICRCCLSAIAYALAEAEADND